VLGKTGLSSGLPTGAEVDAIMGVVTGLTFRVLGSYRVPGVTRFVGLFVTGIVGASKDAIKVFVGVLSRGRGPAETPRSTGDPSLGNWSWRDTRVQYVLVCDI